MLFRSLLLLPATVRPAALLTDSPPPDLILHHARIVTGVPRPAVVSAIALRDGRIQETGEDAEILRRRGPRTEVLDLEGRMVLPGLMDSHTHPADAAMTEWDHSIPSMQRIQDVLDYVRARAKVVPAGEWIAVRQVFITRLAEQRYPTRAELDQAAPRHPVLFATGPDASLNSLALQRSGIDRDFQPSDGGSGFAERDPVTGDLTGLLRNCSRFVTVPPPARTAGREEKLRRITALFADYNASGLTSICDRDANAEQIELYKELHGAGRLTVRLSISQHVESIGPMSSIQGGIRAIASDPLFLGRTSNQWLRIIGIKTYLDGGMLTGSAFMREPWGVSAIYGIKDPAYRGVRFIPKDRLKTMVQTAVEGGLQFTAHSVGDGAVHALLEVYDELDHELPASTPLRLTRPSISHCNFMSQEAVEQAARLGVFLDVQPAWLHLDTRTLVKQFGSDRLRWFQPLRSLLAAGVTVGGGSDHMQKIGANRAINPYSPFLGMATSITRLARDHPGPLHPEEALTRAQAIQLYTLNNARLLGCDRELGSLEPGKRADLIVIDTDLMTCPEEAIARTRVLRTYIEGRLVHSADPRAP